MEVGGITNSMVEKPEKYSGQMARSILTVISQVDIGFLWYYHYICLLPLKTHENGIMRKTSGKIQWRAFHKIANKKSLKV